MLATPHATRLQLLGSFGLRGANGAPIAIASRRARGLLAYLYLARDHGAAREQLCGLLWSDRGETQARSSLRQCLFDLRNLLSAAHLDILDAGRDRICLQADTMGSDITELRAALDDHDTAPLVALLGLVGRARLLEDLDLPGLFEDWLAQTRSEFDQSLASRVQARLADLAAAERWPELRALAEAYLIRDPLDEAVVAAAIRADAAIGAVAAAHRRFQSLRTALAKEFAVAPGAIVREAMAAVAARPLRESAAKSQDAGEIAGSSPVAELPEPDKDPETPKPRTEVLGGGRPTLAVLSFENPNPLREQLYLAEGIAEDIASALTKFKWLFVMSPRSSLKYDYRAIALQEIRRDLGVRYVVHGRFLAAADALHLSVNLSDCMLGDTLWSRRFEEPVVKVFEIQDEMIATIVGALEPALFRREEEVVTKSEPRNLEHWGLFIRGRWHFWQLTRRDMATAQTVLTQALELRRDDPQTLSFLAFTHIIQLWSGWTADAGATLAKARRLAMRAVRVGNDDAFAHYTLGTALTLTGDLERAVAEQRFALEINPNLAGAMGELGRYFAFSGDYDQAMSYLDKAIRTSPCDVQLFLWLRHKAVAAFTANRLKDAVALAKDAVACRPDVSFNHYLLAAMLAADGEVSKAKESFAEAERLLPTYSMSTMKFSNPFAHHENMARYVQALTLCGWQG